MTIQEFKENIKTNYLADEYLRLDKEENSVKEMLATDPTMAEMAGEELTNLQSQKETIWKQMEGILTEEKQEEEFPNEVIMEFRAGVGGEEAALFAEVLAKMYAGYAGIKGWSFTPVDESRNDIGGYKEASFEIKGLGVYKELRYETGIHRIQRIPETEKNGRVHTSTASVAVLPIRKKSSVEIKPSDLLIEFSRAGGKGGQNVNKVETAVRIVHKPSGLEVRCVAERSQSRNKEKAMAILTAKLEQQKSESDAVQFAKERKDQIGTADRSEKIRNYNILQDRITDHRVKQSWYNIEKILSGENVGDIINFLGENIGKPVEGNDSDEE
jgi:peptide chain release factor 1